MRSVPKVRWGLTLQTRELKRHIITIALLFLAIAFYVAGAARPGMIFLVLGVLAEITFWFRVFGKRRNK